MNCKKTLAGVEIIVAAALAALLWGGRPAVARDMGAAGTDLQSDLSDSADSASKYLGNVYKDEGAGIRIAPPAGSKIINRAGNEIVSFTIDQKQWVGDVLAITLKDDTTVDAYLRSLVAAISKDFKGVQVLESRDLTFDKRKAARLTTTMEADITPRGARVKQYITLYRQQLLVQTGGNTFILLTFYTPLKDKDVATATFNAMLANFEIIDRAQADIKRLDAIKLGKSWLAARSAEELKSKLINQPQWFRMKAGDKDVGYMLFNEYTTDEVKSSELRKQFDGYDGVVMQVNSQSWPPDGSVVMAQNLAFWAYSHDEKTGELRPGYSTWQNVTKRFVKGKNLPNGQYLFWIQEAGLLIEQDNTRIDPAVLAELKEGRKTLLRKKELAGYQIPPPIDAPQAQMHLIVNYTGDPTQAFQGGKGVDALIPSYRAALLPKILEYVWPQLVDLSKPSEMVFAVYNSATRKMTFRTLSVIGPDRIVIDGKTMAAIKCRDEVENSGSTIWVDSSGRILKMLTTDQSLIEATTQEKMTRLWGDAIAKVKQELHPEAQTADNPFNRPPR